MLLNNDYSGFLEPEATRQIKNDRQEVKILSFEAKYNIYRLYKDGKILYEGTLKDTAKQSKLDYRELLTRSLSMKLQNNNKIDRELYLECIGTVKRFTRAEQEWRRKMMENHNRITEIARQARAAGMSYGKYKAYLKAFSVKEE